MAITFLTVENLDEFKNLLDSIKDILQNFSAERERNNLANRDFLLKYLEFMDKAGDSIDKIDTHRRALDEVIIELTSLTRRLKKIEKEKTNESR